MTVVDPSVRDRDSGDDAGASSPDPVAPAATPPSWWLLSSATLARAGFAFLAGLMLWALVPVVLGWTSHVVLTGSMEPRIGIGDVVLASRADLGEVIPGQVVTFEDPNVPGRTLVHRVTAVASDGVLTTKGDANPTADSHAVDAAHLEGIARLRVRFAGLPLVWLQEGAYLPLGLLVSGLLLGWMLIRRERERDLAWVQGSVTAPTAGDLVPAPAPPGPSRNAAEPELDLTAAEAGLVLADTVSSPHPAPARGRHLTRSAVIVVGVSLLLASSLVLATAHASWGATTKNSGDSWSVSPDAQFGPGTYVSTVQGDNPLFFYRLNQSGGTNATDSSGNGRTGTYTGPWNYQVPGQPLPRNSGLGVSSGGSATCINSPLALTNPTTYSYEVWFRTTTTSGGKIASLEKSQTGTSSQYDRHLYMQNDGRLTFGVWLGYAFTISTPSSYNDGVWHQAVVTMGGAGERLYVDGYLQVSNANTASENYTGWWRFGCGNLGGWPSYPTDPLSSTFNGALSNISVYSSQLSATQVRTHWYAA